MYESMSERQLEEFASTKLAGKPEHVRGEKAPKRSKAARKSAAKNPKKKAANRRRAAKHAR
jgi:hypothetical protein